MDELLDILVFKGYLLFFAWILLNRLGVPVPATPALLAAGALVGLGEWKMALVLLLAVAATLASDSVWYVLGRRYGKRILRLICRVTLQPETWAQRAEDFLSRHGARSLLITKFIPGMNRTVLPLTGTARISYPRFLTYDFFGALIWAAAYSALGYAFSDTLDKALKYARHVGWFAIAVLLVVSAAAYLAWRYAARKRRLAEALAVEHVSAQQVRDLLETDEEREAAG